RTSEVSAPVSVDGEPAAPLRRLPHGADLVMQLGYDSSSTYQINAGDLYAVSYSYTNQGPDEALDVTLTIDVEGPFTGVRLNSGTGGGPGDATCRLEGRGRIVCMQARLAAGARTTSSFLVQAPLTRATINLTAVLTSSTE